MRVLQISGRPEPGLAAALAEFEAPFIYPLGPNRRFRISHGEDYTLFFRAIGDEVYFVAEHLGRVVGTLGTVIRRLWLPDGTERQAAYLGDLKIAAEARGGVVLARLARAAEAWLRPRVGAAFGVIMGGTAISPGAYTGRAGIPVFQEIARLAVLRITAAGGCVREPASRFQSAREDGMASYRRLSFGRHACPPVEARLRSVIAPIWLKSPDGSACGMLEDTRRAKRLIAEDGSELLSAHLSYFAFDNPASGATLLQTAVVEAARLGFPALFVAVAEGEVRTLREALPELEILAAPAAVFGTGLKPGAWNINCAEI